MNIDNLKALIAGLPSDCTPEQFSAVELEIEDILASQRRADEAELAETLAKAAKLQEKLGKPVMTPPPVRPVRQVGDTDADAGISYGEEDVSRASFQAELADLRRRGVEKRRRREH